MFVTYKGTFVLRFLVVVIVVVLLLLQCLHLRYLLLCFGGWG